MRVEDSAWQCPPGETRSGPSPPDGDGGPALHDSALLHIDVAGIADTAVVQFGQQRKHASSGLTSLCKAQSHFKRVHLNHSDHWK